MRTRALANGSRSYQATPPDWTLLGGPLKWKATPERVGTSCLEAPPRSVGYFNTHVVLFCEHHSDQTDHSFRLGKIPTTSVLLRMSRLRRSWGLLLQTRFQTSWG